MQDVVYSFQRQRLYLFGAADTGDFGFLRDQHALVTPSGISEDHYSAAAEYNGDIDGAIYAFDGEVNTEAQLDVLYCYRNGIPLVVWNRSDEEAPAWLRFHALSVFSSKEQVGKVLLSALGFFEQSKAL